MKKLLILSSLFAALAGCGGGDDAPSPAPAPAPAPQLITTRAQVLGLLNHDPLVSFTEPVRGLVNDTLSLSTLGLSGTSACFTEGGTAACTSNAFRPTRS